MVAPTAQQTRAACRVGQFDGQETKPPKFGISSSWRTKGAAYRRRVSSSQPGCGTIGLAMLHPGEALPPCSRRYYLSEIDLARPESRCDAAVDKDVGARHEVRRRAEKKVHYGRDVLGGPRSLGS